MPTTTEKNYALEQAIAQVESIIELTRRLDREDSAEDYVKSLSDDDALKLWREYSGYADDTAEDAREKLVEHIVGRRLRPDDYGFDYNFEDDSEAARDEIAEDPLEISYRTGWVSEFPDCQQLKDHIEEAAILLCTGGPAVRILCKYDRGSLTNPVVQYQDWGTPWTDLYLPSAFGDRACQAREALETYISCFDN